MKRIKEFIKNWYRYILDYSSIDEKYVISWPIPLDEVEKIDEMFFDTKEEALKYWKENMEN